MPDWKKIQIPWWIEQEYLFHQIRYLNEEKYITRDEVNDNINDALGLGFNYITILLWIISIILAWFTINYWRKTNKLLKDIENDRNEIRALKKELKLELQEELTDLKEIKKESLLKFEESKDNIINKITQEGRKEMNSIIEEIRAEWVKEMNKIVEKMVKQGKKDTEEHVSNLFYKALIRKWGIAFDKEEYESALDLYKESLIYEQEIFKWYSYNHIWNSYYGLWMKKASNQDYSTAIENYQKAIENYQKAIEYHQNLKKYFIENNAKKETIKWIEENISDMETFIKNCKQNIEDDSKR